MNHRLPTDDQIVRYILNECRNEDSIDPVYCLDVLYTELETAIKISNLHTNCTDDYVYYLNYFKKFIDISRQNPNSALRRKLDDVAKLKRLHQIL